MTTQQIDRARACGLGRRALEEEPPSIDRYRQRGDTHKVLPLGAAPDHGATAVRIRSFGTTQCRFNFSIGSVAMKFKAKVIPSGNATGIEVPRDVMKGLGSEARPLIAITINGHTWRSRIALMRGQRLVGISAANRVASGISEGDKVAVEINPDLEPRLVAEPPDLTAALRDHPKARAAFDRQPFGLKRKQVADIAAGKSAETRRRRIATLVAKMRA